MHGFVPKSLAEADITVLDRGILISEHNRHYVEHAVLVLGEFDLTSSFVVTLLGPRSRPLDGWEAEGVTQEVLLLEEQRYVVRGRHFIHGDDDLLPLHLADIGDLVDGIFFIGC